MFLLFLVFQKVLIVYELCWCPQFCSKINNILLFFRLSKKKALKLSHGCVDWFISNQSASKIGRFQSQVSRVTLVPFLRIFLSLHAYRIFICSRALFRLSLLLIWSPKLTSIPKEAWLGLHLGNVNTLIHKTLRITIVLQLSILHRLYSLFKVILGNLSRTTALAHTLWGIVPSALFDDR
jgi:hypothetical protein